MAWVSYLREYDAGFGSRESRYHDGPRAVFVFFVIPSDVDPKNDYHLLYDEEYLPYRVLYVDKNSPDLYLGADNKIHSKNPDKFSYTIKGNGKYGLYWGLMDTFQDSNVSFKTNSQWWYYGVASWNIKFLNEQDYIDSEEDDSYAEVLLIDKSNGNVIDSHKYRGSLDGKLYSINYTIPKGKSYQIKYVLHKSTGTSGGLDNVGGGFTLSYGGLIESWNDYCVDNLGNYYSKGNPPDVTVPPALPSPPDVEPIDLVPDDSWVWIDTIKVVEYESASTNSNVSVSIYDENDNLISSGEYYAEDGEQGITATITNDSRHVKSYKLVMTFNQDNSGDGAYLYDGGFTIKDFKEMPSSHVEFSVDKLVEYVPRWMGGWDGSKIYIKVYDEQNNAVYSDIFDGESVHEFGVSSLSNLPYSNYRMEITTEQKGCVSPYTGKEYYSAFKLMSFNAYEKWAYVPDAFSSKLEFYINNQLLDSHNTMGSYSAVHSVAKGKHEYKWVFSTANKGENWDYARLDWLRLTKWICDKVLVVPYCEPGNGDKCIEALIRCLLLIVKNRPSYCKLGKKIWLFT